MAAIKAKRAQQAKEDDEVVVKPAPSQASSGKRSVIDLESPTEPSFEVEGSDLAKEAAYENGGNTQQPPLEEKVSPTQRDDVQPSMSPYAGSPIPSPSPMKDFWLHATLRGCPGQSHNKR